MPYRIIVFICSTVLTGKYLFEDEARSWSKVLATVLLLVSLNWRYGMYLQAALAVALSLYFTYRRALHNPR